MTDISKRFEQLISSTQKKLAENNRILPIKTEEGILVGDVLIKSNGHLKDLYKADKLIYKEVNLNEVTIRLANLLAKNCKFSVTDKIYNSDQEYSKWFLDCQIFKQKYHSSIANKDFDKADIYYARYQEALIKAKNAKSTALSLVQ